MRITVFTKNHCPKCMMTKHLMNIFHVPFKEVNMSNHTQYFKKFTQKGIHATPIVKINNKIAWWDFQDKNIKKLAHKLA